MNKPVTRDDATATQPFNIKLILIGIVVILVLGAILYGVGLSKGGAQLVTQKADSDARIQTLQSQLNESQQKFKNVQNRVHLMEARAGLYRTALDLERRNFGIANTRLKESAAMLQEVQGEAGLDINRLDTLRQAIAQTDINVAVDLESQRNKVVDFATQLEALTPREAQESLTKA